MRRNHPVQRAVRRKLVTSVDGWDKIYDIKMLLLFLTGYILSISSLCVSLQNENRCRFVKSDKKGTVEECRSIKPDDQTNNLPLIDGVYCFNNGSGICKAFAGRYEFYYDSFNDKFLRSASESDNVDANGYHKRVPVAYTINGDMMYADRSINWARQFAKHELKDKKVSLLSIDVINWCAFVADNNWPYKSAIKYEQYQIYFFNRQSCIIDTSTDEQKKQHFNTRFLHNSSVRIDLDMNPTIYTMEDNITNDIRLIKHKRQHWYEVKFKVLKKPTPELDYFVDMEPTDQKPCKICGGRPILPNTAYREISDLCLSDDKHERRDESKNNAELVEEYCGLDETEIADYPQPVYNIYDKEGKMRKILEVDLHNIPRRPYLAQSFFGVNIANDREWQIFAKDGMTFSAATTIPTSETNKVRVILLYATFSLGGTVNKYEEYDPMPYIADYEATFTKGSTVDDGRWTYNEAERKQVQAKNLNYVDDIAYLYKCKSLLVIFGPLYSELPLDNKITLETKGFVNSIYELGIHEPTNAFFAMPDDSNVLWVYYRANYMAEHQYSCDQPMVTAKRVGSYRQRYGPGGPDWLYYFPPTFPVHEEMLFQHIGVFKGSVDPADAPDPQNYLSDYLPPPKPLEEKNQTYIYIIIAIGVLLIVIMCIICMIAVRRRIKRRRHQKTIRSGGIGSDQPGTSVRSLMSWLPFGGSSAGGMKTQRSAMSSHSPSKKGSSRAPTTVRSARTSTPTKSAATMRSPSLGSSHRGSQASLSSKHSNRSGHSSHGPSSAGSTARSAASKTHRPAALSATHSKASSHSKPSSSHLKTGSHASAKH